MLSICFHYHCVCTVDSQSQFRHYLLFKIEEAGRVIGRGAYGEVVEMLLHGTKVAGKKIHSIFFDSSNDSDHVGAIKEIFQQECVRYVYVEVNLLFTCVIKTVPTIFFGN